MNEEQKKVIADVQRKLRLYGASTGAHLDSQAEKDALNTIAASCPTCDGHGAVFGENDSVSRCPECGFTDGVTRSMPEVVRGGKGRRLGRGWKTRHVERAAAKVDRKRKTIMAPTSNEPQDARARFDSMAAAQYTPQALRSMAEADGLDLDTLASVEKGRVRVRSKQAGFDGFDAQVYNSGDIASAVAAGAMDPITLGNALTSLIGTGDFDPCCNAVSQVASQLDMEHHLAAVEVARAASLEMGKVQQPSVAKSIETAKLVQQALGRIQQQQQQQQQGEDGDDEQDGGDEQQQGDGNAMADDAQPSNEQQQGDPSEADSEQQEQQQGDGQQDGDQDSDGQQGDGQQDGDQQDGDGQDDGQDSDGQDGDGMVGSDQQGQGDGQQDGDAQGDQGSDDQDSDGEGGEPQRGEFDPNVRNAGGRPGGPKGDQAGAANIPSLEQLAGSYDDSQIDETFDGGENDRAQYKNAALIPDSVKRLFGLQADRKQGSMERDAARRAARYAASRYDSYCDDRGSYTTASKLTDGCRYFAYEPVTGKEQEVVSDGGSNAKLDALHLAQKNRRNIVVDGWDAIISKHGTYCGDWGEVVIERVPLPNRARGEWKRPRRNVTDTGCIPTAMHRLTVDSKVFADKRARGARPTILVDMSGSMSLQPSEVAAMVKAHPYCTIALYAGHETWGIIRIVAEGGWYADDRDIKCPTIGGNTIDGPALEWLSRMPQPRIWMSDGGVCGGHNDTHSKPNRIECVTHARKLVQRNQVKQLLCLSDAGIYLKECAKKGKLFLAVVKSRLASDLIPVKGRAARYGSTHRVARGKTQGIKVPGMSVDFNKHAIVKEGER